MELKLTSLCIDAFLSDRSPFTIPMYQRPYAWGPVQVMDFIHDLMGLVDARLRGGRRRGRHFGHITSVHRLVAGSSSGTYDEVVDGQQRLATFSIFFSLLAQKYEHLAREARDDPATALQAREHAGRVRSDLLWYDDKQNGKPIVRHRVYLSIVDEPYFSHLLDGDARKPIRASHELLYKAHKLIRGFIDRFVADTGSVRESLELLRILEDVARKDCYIVHQVTYNGESAQLIFEGHNNRGVGLAQCDLLHSGTLGLLAEFPDLLEAAASAWITILWGKRGQIEQQLGVVYTSHTGRRPNKALLRDQIIEEFFGPLEPRGDKEKASQVLATIENMAVEIALVRQFEAGDWPFEQGKRGASVCMWDKHRLTILMQKKTLGHTLCSPLLLAATALSEHKFAAMVQLIERFFFRYAIVCGEHVGKLEDVYTTEAVVIRADPDAYEVERLAERLRKLGARATDAMFRAKLSTRIRYKPNNNNAHIQYFLATVEQFTRWVEEGACGTPRCLESGVIFQLSQLHLEHIYPQNSKSKNPQLERHKHRLGNISFWSPHDNRKASNDDFADKRHIYRESSIAMNRRLAHLEAWGLAEIEAREEQLLDLACKIFVV